MSRTRILFLLAMSLAPGQVDHARGASDFDISPDDRAVVFSSNDGDLYLLTLSTNAVARLTSTEVVEGSPAFSPDGGSIAYSVGEKGREGSRLFIRALDGTSARPITAGRDVADFSPCFSPDGKRIAFIRAHGLRDASMGGKRWADFDLYVTGCDGGEPRRLTTEHYWSAASPSFTRGGQSLIFVGEVNNYPAPSHALLKRVDSDGSRPPAPFGPGPPADLRRIGAWASAPCVSHDGNRLVFVSDRAKPFAYDLYVVGIDGTSPTPLGMTNSSRLNGQPRFMRDGKRILFLGVEKGQQHYGLWEADVDGKNPHQLADSGLFADPANWKPSVP